MKIDLPTHVNEYRDYFCVLLYADARIANNERSWVYVNKYPTLSMAKEGKLNHYIRHGEGYVYKIMEFTINAKTRS